MAEVGLYAAYDGAPETGDPPRRTVSVTNVAADGSCLELSGLRLTYNGRSIGSTLRAGGRSREAHMPLPFQGSVACTAAEFTFDTAFPDDPTRERDRIEVTDGTRTVSMEIANLLGRMTLVPSPPAELPQAGSFRARVLPPIPGRTICVAELRPDSSKGPIPLQTQAIAPGVTVFTVPADAPVGSAQLSVIRCEDKAELLPALACGADRCGVLRGTDRSDDMTVRVVTAAPEGGAPR